jgi:hypothetical protein
VNEAIADGLRGLSAKLIADRVETNVRTAENWKQARTGPQIKHVVAMLNDNELCARLLEAAGRSDLARAQETITALKAALISEGK